MNVISLFSGIGGIDLGFKQAGFDIIWANDKDASACKTYRHNFGDKYLVEGDISKIQVDDIPDSDVLVAGFPCQPFSIAGKQRGFNDKRGNLFFEIAKIIDGKRPRIVFLENVANLVEHDNGRTFLVIYNILAQFGYTVYYKIMSATDYGNLPQARKRIYITAVHESIGTLYYHPEKLDLTLKTSDIIHRNEKKDSIYYEFCPKTFKRLETEVVNKDAIYRMRDAYPKALRSLYCPTLTASMGTHKDCVPVLLDDFAIRKLTIRECLDFQGFPKSFSFPKTISLMDAYKQIGNSVCVPVIERIAVQIKKLLCNDSYNY